MNKDVFSTNLLLSKNERQENDTGSLRDKNLELMLKEAYNRDNIEMKTDLNANQINALTRGKMFAKTFNCSIMEDMINENMVLLVSKGRQGRKEWIQMAKSTADEPIDMGGIRSRLLGG